MSRKSAVQPRDQESPFAIHELFFSTTDRKGVITFGNDVFVRVSGHPRERLIGAPHNVIRHPDMPRAVFRLLWDYLLAGKSVVAYVKNMAADGAYYWVVALVTPIRDGFLSVRLKPSSPVFGLVRALYVTMRQTEMDIEAADGDREKAIEASTAQLQQAVRSLGYATYDELMQHILVTEVTARKHALEKSPGTGETATVLAAGAADADDPRAHCASIAGEVGGMFAKLESFLELDRALADKVAFVRTFGSGLRLMSLNAQLRAASLGEEGRTLQVVAEQMSGSARATSSSSQAICGYMAEMTSVLRAAAAHIATSDLSVEMIAYFLDEMRGTAAAGGTTVDDAARHRVAQLAEVLAEKLQATVESVASASASIASLELRLDDFLKQVRTLEILRVTGKVEAVGCELGDRVSTVFEEVHTRTKDARQKLAALIELIARARLRPPDRRLIARSLTALGVAA